MPRASGVYSLPAGYLAVTGQTIQASQHNPPLEDIGAALTGSLPRDGSAAMTAPIQLVDGTSSAPGMAFASAPTKGFYLDASGNIVPTAPFLANILPVGLGPLPWSLLNAPSGWVLCYGQTLSRTTYAALWTAAQAEIAAGNTLYNNGNGTTTFGIADLRGRVAAGSDVMGGVSADRLNPTITSGILGATGGSQSRTLTTANLPAYTPSGTITNGAITSTPNQASVIGGSGGLAFGSGSGGGQFTLTITSTQAASTFTGTAQGGTSASFAIVQPTIITNYILYAGA